MQDSYNTGNGQVILNGTNGPLIIRDGYFPVGNFLRITDFADSNTYFASSVSAVTINTNVNASGSTIWKVPGFNSNRLFSNEIDGALNTNTLRLQSAGNFDNGGQIIFATGLPDADGRRAESARISPQGYLGIGTASPSRNIDVYQASSAGIKIGSVNSTAVWSVSPGTMSLTTDPSSVMTLGNNSMVINAGTGNVGIGSSSPASVLVINRSNPANIGATLALRNATGNVGDKVQIRFEVGGILPNGTLEFGAAAGGDSLMSINTTSSGVLGERLRIAPSGNIGIGTTSTTSLLTVSGGIRSLSEGIIFPDGSTQASAFTGSVTFVTVPASPNSSGAPGQMAYSSGYLYVAIAVDQWARFAVDTSWP